MKKFNEFINEQKRDFTIQVKDAKNGNKIKVDVEYLALTGEYWFELYSNNKLLCTISGGRFFGDLLKDGDAEVKDASDKKTIYAEFDNKIATFYREPDYENPLFSLHGGDLEKIAL